MISRRHFLEGVGAGTAAGVLARLPRRRLWSLTPGELLPEPDEAWLRELAARAMDSARAAGAGFADVRVLASRFLTVWGSYVPEQSSSPVMGAPGVGVSYQYGVRALVDGAWGFACGTDLTADGIAQAARSAAELARANRPRHSRRLPLAPAPVVNGVWATPMERDPLRVPIGEQGDLILAALAETVKPGVARAGIMFPWRRPTTVFASTDGSVIVQRLSTASPAVGISAQVGPDAWGETFTGADLKAGGYGYEAVEAATLVSKTRGTVERAIALAEAGRAATPVEVGRYDVVLSANVVASLLTTTIASAADLELVLGYRQNDEGSSFAAPPEAALGRLKIGSKLLTVHADRSLVHGAATVGWDDEGVKPDDYTFVRDGVLVDYHTNREMAMHLAEWYAGRGEPMRSHGCARRGGELRPVVRVPNLSLAPGTETVSAEDLIADTPRGLYIEGLRLGASDHQMLNTQYNMDHTQVREIRRGKLGGYLKNAAIQFVTPQFWAGLDALGGAESVRATAIGTDPETSINPEQAFSSSTVRAVPARVRRVNVLNLGRTA